MEPAEEEPIEPSDAACRAKRGLKRLALIILGAVGVLLLVAVGTVTLMYFSATATVEEYEAVVVINEAKAEADRLELESQLSAALSESQTRPEWSALVTAAQINGWLATRLRREFPGFAQAGLSQPRVWMEQDLITLAVRADVGRIDGVLSVKTKPSVTEHGELVLEILEAKIGRLAIPLGGVVAQAKQTPLEKRAPVRWVISDSQTAVVVDLERIDLPEARSLRLVGVDVRPGELLIRGENVEANALDEQAAE